MADKKRVVFYWIKLKDNFMFGDAVDFLMGQKNGAEYVVLYQMLCLKTANTEGRLAMQFGEILMQYNSEKIQRDCKFFSLDTVNVALTLYKKLGLIYTENDGCLCISKHNEMVGKETRGAELKRAERLHKGDNKGDNVAQEKEKEIDNNSNNLVTEISKVCVIQHDTHTQNLCKLISNILPTVVINCDPSLTEDEYRAIAIEFAKSEFCKQTFCTLLKVQKHHKQILSGDFRDFKKKDATKCNGDTKFCS